MLLLIFNFLIVVNSYPSYLDDPQDCYVPDPMSSCVSSSSCKNKGGSSDCFYAMGKCLTSDNDASITVEGVTVGVNQGVEVDSFTGSISISVSTSSYLQYFAVVSNGATISASGSYRAMCSNRLARYDGDKLNSFTISVSDTSLDEIHFTYMRASGYGQIYGSKVTIKKAQNEQTSSPTPLLTSQPTPIPTHIPTYTEPFVCTNDHSSSFYNYRTIAVTSVIDVTEEIKQFFCDCFHTKITIGMNVNRLTSFDGSTFGLSSLNPFEDAYNEICAMFMGSSECSACTLELPFEKSTALLTPQPTPHPTPLSTPQPTVSDPTPQPTPQPSLSWNCGDIHDQNNYVIDVRTLAEWNEGHLMCATRLTLSELNKNQIDELTGGNTQAKLLIYCRSGARAGVAVGMVQSWGYANVHNIGGFTSIMNQCGDCEPTTTPNPTLIPTMEPTFHPTSQPTPRPTAQQSPQPTREPKDRVTPIPTAQPVDLTPIALYARSEMTFAGMTADQFTTHKVEITAEVANNLGKDANDVTLTLQTTRRRRMNDQLNVLCEVVVTSKSEADQLETTMVSDSFANALVSDIQNVDSSLSSVSVEVASYEVCGMDILNTQEMVICLNNRSMQLEQRIMDIENEIKQKQLFVEICEATRSALSLLLETANCISTANVHADNVQALNL